MGTKTSKSYSPLKSLCNYFKLFWILLSVVLTKRPFKFLKFLSFWFFTIFFVSLTWPCGSQNFKTLLLPQIALELFKTFFWIFLWVVLTKTLFWIFEILRVFWDFSPSPAKTSKCYSSLKSFLNHFGETCSYYIHCIWLGNHIWRV